MGVTFLPVNSEVRYKSKYGPELAALSKLHEDETTIILSEDFRSLFNLVKLEEKPSDTFLQALVLTVGNPPAFLVFLPSDHAGQTARQSPSRDGINVHVAKLVRSLTSVIHSFSEESIAIALVSADPDDLSSLKEQVEEAEKRLPASRRGMTPAVYVHLLDAVTAALGHAACMVGFANNHPKELGVVSNLKRNKGRMRGLFLELGNVIWQLEDVQSPRISSPTSYDLGRTLELPRPTLVVCNERNRESLKEILRKLEWDVVTRPTAETTSHFNGTVLVVDMDEKEGSRIADLFKAATSVLRICVRCTVSSSSLSPDCSCAYSPSSLSDLIEVSHKGMNFGASETSVETTWPQPSKGKRRSRRILDRSVKRSRNARPCSQE